MNPALVDHLVAMVKAMHKADRDHDAGAFYRAAIEWLRASKGDPTDLYDLIVRNGMQARPIAIRLTPDSLLAQRLCHRKVQIYTFAGGRPRYILWIAVRPAINSVAEMLTHHPTERHNREALRFAGIAFTTALASDNGIKIV